MNGILDAFKLDGKVAVVTGSERGLGRGMAVALAQAGADIVGVTYTESAPETAAAVEATGRKYLHIQANLLSIEPVERVVETALKAFGHIDILVNNAGIITRNDSVDFTEKEWDDVMNINLKTAFFMCQAVGRQFIKQGTGGKIVNIASMAALMQGPAMSNYNVAKAGVVALSESLLIELQAQQVGVHVVCPSFFQTNLLDSFRGPTPAMKQAVGKLLESSPISATEIAEYIYTAIEQGEFMILPHEQGRMAWALKQKNPQLLYSEMASMAGKMRSKTTPV